ncbi:nucleoside deaminase [soil metagenome]
MNSNAALPEEKTLDERDGRYLRKAIVWSHAARRRGNPPYGSIIVSAGNEVLAEAFNNIAETGDLTGHAELNAIRALAGRGVTRDDLKTATIYASGEPCVMCAGAIFWSGIGRVVYGLDVARMQKYHGDGAEVRSNAVSCRDVFRASPHAIECIGPALVHDAGAAHEGASGK